MAYRIDFAEATHSHLEALSAGERRRIRDAINVQLTDQPTTETRNRKRMRQNPVAEWELRVGTFRVYYDVIDDPEPIVTVRAIAVKDREKTYAGGEELPL